LIYLGLSGVINVVLNLIFVLVFGMNVEGVALATTISQAVSAVLVVNKLMRRTDACKLELKNMRIYGPQLQKMIRIGLPAGIQGSMFSISNVMIQSSINSFGDIVMSGNTAAGNIEGFVFTAMNAFHQTAVNFTGQNVGARQYDRVKKILWTCLACVGVTGLVLGLGMYAFGPQLLSIYITDSQEAIRYGLVRLGYICAVYFLCGLMDVSTGALRGMGSSIIPMIISVLGVCGVRLLWIGTVFQIYHTTDCLYLSYGVSWVITFAAQFIAFWMVYKKHTKRAESL
jgi:Na+-driven multidrug efflux pump